MHVPPPPPPDVPADGTEDPFSENIDRARPFSTVKDQVRHLEQSLTPRGTQGSRAEGSVVPNIPNFSIATPSATSGNVTPNVEQPRPVSPRETLRVIMSLENRLQEMQEENKKAFQKIDDERNAERKRWAEEIMTIKYVEEWRKNTTVSDSSDDCLRQGWRKF